MPNLKLIKTYSYIALPIFGIVLLGAVANLISKNGTPQQSAITVSSSPTVASSVAVTSNTDAIIIAKVEHVNLRNQPSINSSVVDELHTGDKVVIVDKQNNESGELWFKVKVNRKVGWVYKDLISAGNVTSDTTAKATPSVEPKFNDATCDAFSPGVVNGAVVYRFKTQSGGYRYLLMTDRQPVVDLFPPNFFTAKSEVTDAAFDDNMTNAARGRFYDLITSYKYVANISEITAKGASPFMFGDGCI